MNDEELKEMLKLYTKKDLWEFNQIKAKKQIELMAQIKEQDQKIKELQMQLAEKNELFIATKWRADDLEKQLAEKEKENSVLKAVIDKNKTGQFGAVNICNAISEFYEPLVKDMIIAELEKVKDKTDALMFKINNMNYFIMVKEELYNFIDQQITEIKGEK